MGAAVLSCTAVASTCMVAVPTNTILIEPLTPYLPTIDTLSAKSVIQFSQIYLHCTIEV